MTAQPSAAVRCSFCNKPQAEVRKLIAGPSGVAICDECVDVCQDIIADHVGPQRRAHAAARTVGELSADRPELFPFQCPSCGHKWKVAFP